MKILRSKDRRNLPHYAHALPHGPPHPPPACPTGYSGCPGGGPGASISSVENVSMLTGGRDPLCSNKIMI